MTPAKELSRIFFAATRLLEGKIALHEQFG